MSGTIIGEHPLEHPYGVSLSACDSETVNGFPHRELTENGNRNSFLAHTVNTLRTHHISEENLERRRTQIAKFKIKGFDYSRLLPYPQDENVQRGNFAEVVTAEYLAASTSADLPVYRLRYNTNPNQSMKGDDVLLFDLDSDPVRIIVAESKFRGTPSKSAVVEMIEGLERSSNGSLPVSLVFVSDRLCEEGQTELGARVLNCAELLADNKLQIDYVGLLLSNCSVATHVHRNTVSTLRNLLVISLGINAPEGLVQSAFDELEGEL